MPSPREEIKTLAEADLKTFINLVHPNRVLGQVHEELLTWWTRQEAKSHQVLLLPRDHCKSSMVAYRVAWEITRNPAIRILYISATTTLATKQLKFIKDILTSPVYRHYWPEMINEREFTREKWTETEIAVDHPKRKEEVIRDSTVFVAGLTTTITGLHCDIAVFDDVVSPDNAYTAEGRNRVQAQYSQLASIEGTEARQYVVGTRYHPKDLYGDMAEMEVDIYDEDGNFCGTNPLYEKFERQVESQGDGTGEFLWPRQQRADGKWFGFDQAILARKRVQYLDKTQFRAQYYNDPRNLADALISSESFQYYDPTHLNQRDGHWQYRGARLNVFASVDFAYTLGTKSDYTCIVTVGVDSQRNYYVLDIDRFKTELISEYFKHILSAHEKWGFRRFRAEVTAAQSVIVKDLKENYIRPYGLALSVEDYRPVRAQGSKEERVLAVLQPKYDNQQVWHYKGGNVQILEEELSSMNPAHDDVKDTLASCIDMAVPPSPQKHSAGPKLVYSNSRFGGA